MGNRELPKSIYHPNKLRVPVTQAWCSDIVKATQQKKINIIESNLNLSLVLFGKHQIGAGGHMFTMTKQLVKPSF